MASVRACALAFERGLAPEAADGSERLSARPAITVTTRRSTRWRS